MKPNGVGQRIRSRQDQYLSSQIMTLLRVVMALAASGAAGVLLLAGPAGAQHAGYGRLTVAGDPSIIPVGVQVAAVADVDGKTFPVGVWYPADVASTSPAGGGAGDLGGVQNAPIAGRGLPLVVISHGNGGGMMGHIDLVLTLASAGYVVAAPNHPGDNFQDPSASGSARLYSDSNRQLRLTVEHLLTKWKGHEAIDAEKVGAFGFSAGGFTVLTAVGAQPEMQLIPKQCAQAPEFICDVLRHDKSPLVNADAPPGEPMQASRSVKAAVIAGPGLGFTMTPAAMVGVKVPVQLWSGEKDVFVPYASNTKIIIDSLERNGQRAEFHSVPNAAHLSFLSPCGPVKNAERCKDPEGFDRDAFHAEMNKEVLQFFDRHLKR
jgi:predicted dienelactone hydrolase